MAPIAKALAASLVIALVIAAPAQAYVGPALGLAPLGVMLGMMLTFLSTLGYMVMQPLRRLWRQLTGSAEAKRPSDSGSAPGAD